MHIRGTALYCLGQNRIDKADNWSVVFLLQKIFRFRDRIGERGQIHIIANAFDHLHGFCRVVLISRIERLVKVVRLNGGKSRAPTAYPVGLRQCRMGSTGSDQNNRVALFRAGQNDAVTLRKGKGETTQRSILRLKFGFCAQGGPRSYKAIRGKAITGDRPAE